MAGIFKAYDIRGVVGPELTADDAYAIGLGIANELFHNSTKNKLIVSRDMRTHSPELCQQLIKGLLDGGCDVMDIGLAPTPMNYWANVTLDADGSVTVTASHNPAKYNGFKVCGPKAAPIDHASGLDKVESFVRQKKNNKATHTGTLSLGDQEQLLSDYMRFMGGFCSSDNSTLRVAVDCSNGMAGYFMPHLQVPGVEFVPLYWDLDGAFPNHEADPQKVENLRDLQQLVLREKCDFGICFDGDADRAVCVDELGQTVSSDLMTALLAEDYLDRYPGAPILYDLRSSAVVPETITQRGGVPVRTKVGHSFIKQVMKAEQGVFGGELSGHFYFVECFRTDSAMMALLVLVNILKAKKQSLSSLIQKYRTYYASGEVSFRVPDPSATIAAVTDLYKNYQHDMLDGLTVQMDDCWFNLRPSNTEPLLRINLEVKQADLLEPKLKEFSDLINRLSTATAKS